MLMIAYSCAEKKEQKNGAENAIKADIGKSDIQSDTVGLYLFWEEFKSLAMKGDFLQLAEISYFPFLNHGSFITKKEFYDVRFPDYILEDIKKSNSPVKSDMIFEEGVDSRGNIVESPFNGDEEWPVFAVDLNGASLYFSKIDGKFVFIGLLYGE